MRQYRFCEALITAVIITVIIVWVGVAWGEDFLTLEIWRKDGETLSGDLEVRAIRFTPDPNQVTAYRATDGELFESREEMEEHDRELNLESKRKKILAVMLKKDGLPLNSEDAEYRAMASFIIIAHWPEIKAIMEPEAKP